jgi:aconitate hydratase
MPSFNLVKKHYQNLDQKISAAKSFFNHPLTLTEKILFAHLAEKENVLSRKKSVCAFQPDRVAMQDATAQMALLQFMSAGINHVKAPTTVHCDHLIRAHDGAFEDLNTAKIENKEVFDFLRTASQKYGIGFWKPGAGIIHQVVLENYAFPGGMMIGTDSHTPNAGGLGMLAIGVGGADAVDVMVGEPFGLTWPGIIGVHLSGKLNGWTAPKDVILKVCEILTVKGGTGHIVEYFGSGTPHLSGTGKATICNMGAELGATTSIFPYDDKMAAYLRATGRHTWAEQADLCQHHLVADSEVLKKPEKYYDHVIDINLSDLEPHVAGPHSPDKARTISKLAAETKKENYPVNIAYTLIGSCTNSSYEDIDRVASLAQFALDNNLTLKAPLMITPGSEQVLNTIKRDGQLALFEKLGATVLANACGPCIGQWKRHDITKGQRNTIINSFNRNFRARNDGNSETLSFIASPEIVMAFALSGSLSFNPLQDSLTNEQNITVKLPEPTGKELPQNNFDTTVQGYLPPNDVPDEHVIKIDPHSERLQILSPFEKWHGKDFKACPILLKAKGKCTTDHISPAGFWLIYRGHLDKISDNMFSGATNAFSEQTGTGINIFTQNINLPLAEVARMYKTMQTKWVVIGDENYGEGSSREHAAMEPRYLGCCAVIAKSFARIHETNLKKQGVLPLTFAKPNDYDDIMALDRMSIVGLVDLEPNNEIKVVIIKTDGSKKTIKTKHSLTKKQINWFKEGSALNALHITT